jgi:hypothetical protein
MSFLGTLEGIGAGDPMGSFLKSNNAALDQSYNQAAGKALISMFSGQVPGAQPLGGPPVSSGMPPSVQPPTVPPMPIRPGPPYAGGGPGGPQQTAQAGPQPSLPTQGQPAAVPGALPMPPGGYPSPNWVAGAGPAGAPPGLAQGLLQQGRGQPTFAPQGGGMPPQAPQAPQAPQPGPQAPQGGPAQGPQMQPGQPQGQQAQIPPQMQQQMQQMRQQLQQLQQGVQQNQGQLNWQDLVQGVVKANPGASPMVIAGAVQKLLPLMNANSLQQWRQIQGQLRQDQFGEKVTHDQAIEDIANRNADLRSAGVGIAQQNADTRAAAQADTAGHRRVQEDQGQQRIEIAKSREGRLTIQGQIRNDQRFKDFEFKKQQAEQKAARAKTNDERAAALKEWMAALQAQKAYMNTIVNSDKMAAGTDKTRLLKANEDWIQQERRDMQRKQEGSFSNKFTPAESMPPAMPPPQGQ